MTDKKSNQIEIIDFSGEQFSLCSIPCSISLLCLFLLATLNAILMVFYQGSLLTLILSVFIIFVLIIYFLSWINSPAKLRKFLISEDEIEIIVPFQSPYNKKWSEFDKMEIRLKVFDVKPYEVYELHFINNNSSDSFRISLSDFHKEKINEILVLLKKYSKRLNKKFMAVKESIVSGIILIEDLKI